MNGKMCRKDAILGRRLQEQPKLLRQRQVVILSCGIEGKDSKKKKRYQLKLKEPGREMLKKSLFFSEKRKGALRRGQIQRQEDSGKEGKKAEIVRRKRF